MRIVFPWLTELVDIPVDAGEAAAALALRGFEVAEIVEGSLPVIDFEITANRPDCLSHVGMAREAAATWGTALRLPEMTMPTPGPAEALDVRLEDPERCPRYCAQVFEVQVAPSPAWLQERLHAAGVRPINNIVDVSNYVMLELGHPTHAFDLERLKERTLVIRQARPGERMHTLDGVERTLDAGMVVIADAERAGAIGGVMGGADSEISEATRLVALESAYFHPPSVRKASKRLGLKTEASTRFERGADINAPPVAIARTAVLLHRIGAGRPLGPLVDRYPSPGRPAQVRLRAARLERVLGQAIPADDVPRILQPLGFGVAPSRDGAEPGWLVTVPTYRVDVAREADLVEEVGRHYGFDRLPVTFPALDQAQPPPDPRIARDRRAARVLAASGFSEAMTFAFIERVAAAPYAPAASEPAAITNPLSEKFAVLRPSMVPGLVDAVAHNRRRERRDVRLFETGARFTPDGEGRAVGFAWCGAAEGPHWSGTNRPVDFFDAKGVVELLCRAFGVEPQFAPVERPFLMPGRAAEVRSAGESSPLLGVVGQLAPSVADARGFPPAEPLLVAEIDLDALAAAMPQAPLRAESLPRFPSTARDISILVDASLPAAAVRGTIRSAAPSTLVAVAEFDRYQGKGVPEGRVSLSLRLTFRASDRTLTDEEAEDATTRIVDALAREHGAERR